MEFRLQAECGDDKRFCLKAELHVVAFSQLLRRVCSMKNRCARNSFAFFNLLSETLG